MIEIIIKKTLPESIFFICKVTPKKKKRFFYSRLGSNFLFQIQLEIHTRRIFIFLRT
jgi:hypothetical protein